MPIRNTASAQDPQPRYFKAVGRELESFWTPEMRYPPPGQRARALADQASRSAGIGNGYLWAHTNLEELLPGSLAHAENRWPLRFLELADPEDLITDERHGVGARSWLVVREIPRHCLFGRRGRVIAAMLDQLMFRRLQASGTAPAPKEVVERMVDGLLSHGLPLTDLAEGIPPAIRAAAELDAERAAIAHRVANQAYRVAAITAATALARSGSVVRRRIEHAASLAVRWEALTEEVTGITGGPPRNPLRALTWLWARGYFIDPATGELLTRGHAG